MNGIQHIAGRGDFLYMTGEDIARLKAEANKMATITARTPARHVQGRSNIAQIAAAYWSTKRDSTAKQGA